MFRPRTQPSSSEIAEARAAFSSGELAEMRVLFGEELTGARARALLDTAAAEGWADDGTATVALWGTSRLDVLRCALLECGARQWSDGELTAQLEAWGEPPDLEPYRDEIAAARQLARGRLRDAMWNLTQATRAVVVRQGEHSEIEHVPDNPLRFKALRELLRQHGGYTSQGFAAEVQRQIEKIEREGPAAGGGAATAGTESRLH